MLLQDIKSLLTFVFPVRIDCHERLINLRAVTRYLAVCGCRMIVLEADAKSALSNEVWPDVVEHVFMEDTFAVFHRTRYINVLLSMAETDAVAVWDTDVLAEYSCIYEAVQQIIEGCTIVYPYDGQVVMLPEQMSTYMRRRPDMDYVRQLKLHSFLGRKLCGGAYIVHRNRYMLCGGENERFTGWGPEDSERLHRVRILGQRVTWIHGGQLYHLYHPHGLNSGYQSEEDADNLRREFVKVCSMDKKTLDNYLAR